MTPTDRTARFPVGATVTVADLEGDPRDVLADLRRHEPVSWLPALGAWWVTRRDLALEAMRDAERFTVDDPRFTTARVLGPSMLSLDGPEHRRHREPFAPGFRPGVVRERFDEFLTTEVDRLLPDTTTAAVELRTGLAGPLAVASIIRFLGLDEIGHDEVLDWYHAITKAITGLTVDGAIDPDDATSVEAARERVSRAIEEGTGENLMREIGRSGALRVDELGSAALVLMFGAIETAEGMTTNLLWHLLTTPGVWARVRADPDRLTVAVEESLRVEPAASLIDRYTTGPTRLGEVDLPGGELVTISLLAANHDPATFDDPDVFDLERGNARQHLTFVQGPHACLGLHLARAEASAAARGVLARAAAPELDDDTTGPSGLIFRKPERLAIRW